MSAATVEDAFQIVYRWLDEEKKQTTETREKTTERIYVEERRIKSADTHGKRNRQCKCSVHGGYIQETLKRM